MTLTGQLQSEQATEHSENKVITQSGLSETEIRPEVLQSSTCCKNTADTKRKPLPMFRFVRIVVALQVQPLSELRNNFIFGMLYYKIIALCVYFKMIAITGK